MLTETRFDGVPLWGLYAATFVLLLLADEIGFRIGRYRHRATGEEESKSQASGITASILALLAFMLAFSFSMAATRFADRKQLVVDEANAIGTAYLRSQLLPDPSAGVGMDLLRQYVDVRLEGAKCKDLAELQPLVDRSAELQSRLWDLAIELSKSGHDSVIAGLFVQSVNDVIDLHSKRLTVALRNRIPTTIWATLYFVGFVAMTIMGYHAGLTYVRSMVATVALIATFSAVMVLIIDLDRPSQNLFRVGQDAMVDVQRQVSRPGA